MLSLGFWELVSFPPPAHAQIRKELGEMTWKGTEEEGLFLWPLAVQVGREKEIVHVLGDAPTFSSLIPLSQELLILL